MMDDLISRKAAMKAVEEYVRLRGMPPPEYATNVIKRLPSAPAVPLDKLCELCEETDARVPVPCILCHKIMPEWCKQNNNLPLKWDEEWKCPKWKQLLTKWMEGLHVS